MSVAIALHAVANAADNPAEVFELPSVDVVGVTPLPGLGVALRDVPANVQRFGAADIGRQRPLTITQFLEQNGNSVGIGAGQGNRYQESLDFRGLTASPILGTPQGISVFQDGVRINEAFGDVVNWDLLPRSAISSVQLLPGSMPAFGLNTLGGALALYTKSGAQYPGFSAEISAGSFGTQSAEFEYGGASDRFDWFATANASDDDGWAEHNPSRIRQFFGKAGFQDDRNDLDVTLTLADNQLQGTQTLPRSFLSNPRQAYTFPDENRNRLVALAAKGSRFLAEDVLVGGNAYYRRYKSTNFSSNVNDDFGEARPDDEPPASEAFNDVSAIDQKSFGAGVQLTWQGQIADVAHQLSVGTSGDFGDTRFGQREQSAAFTADRGTRATGAFASLTDVALRNAYVGLFFSDTMMMSKSWTLTAAGRWNRAHVEIRDRSGEDGALNGTSTFTRFNPSVGVNFHPTDDLTAYASYNEGMRAPTPIEITCADPNAPCRLPNEFLSDPPLAKVVAKTVELGLRGKVGAATTWSAAMYRTNLDDDIEFVSSGGGINAGFFRNVGETRRQGLEVAATTRLGPMLVDLRYDHVDATFRSSFAAFSPENSSADANGAIRVASGDRIPGIPADTFRMRLAYQRGAFLIGGGLVAVSSQYAHGDENNADRNGRLPGHVVVNLDAHYDVTPRFAIFAVVTNVLDTRYANFAVLGSNVFTGPGHAFGPALGLDPVAEQFRAVGAPRAIVAGVRIRLGEAR